MRFAHDRRRFVATRARLREALAQRLGVPPAEVRFATGPAGKPSLAAPFCRSGWRFSVSHCGDLALLAFARGREIGVDVERIGPLPEADTLAERFFTQRELAAYRRLASEARTSAFFRLHTRKEAWAKGLGAGLRIPPERLDVLHDAPGWRIESFVPAAGYVAALAWQSD